MEPKNHFLKQASFVKEEPHKFSNATIAFILSSIISISVFIILVAPKSEPVEIDDSPPVVRISSNNYNEYTLNSTFWESPEWEELSNKTVLWALENLDTLIEKIIEKAEILQLNTIDLQIVLSMFHSNSSIIPELWKEFLRLDKIEKEWILVPCLIEKALFNERHVWIIVLNRGTTSDISAFINHINLYVVDSETLFILYETQSR
jgi:hypothetical protein